MDEIVGVEIKQEQDIQKICPGQDWLEILPEIIKTDLDGVVKTEDQYCINYDEDCSNNLPNENEPFLKEENASLGVAEENSVNKIDIDQHEFPTHVILKYKEEYDESTFKQCAKEEQGIERGKNGLDEKILVHQKLDLPKMFPKTVTHLNTEIDLDDIVVKSEDQFCINCDENSSDNLPSENGLVSKDCPSVEAIRSSEVLESENDSDGVKNLVYKTSYDQQDVSRQVEKKKKCNRLTNLLTMPNNGLCTKCLTLEDLLVTHRIPTVRGEERWASILRMCFAALEAMDDTDGPTTVICNVLKTQYDVKKHAPFIARRCKQYVHHASRHEHIWRRSVSLSHSSAAAVRSELADAFAAGLPGCAPCLQQGNEEALRSASPLGELPPPLPCPPRQEPAYDVPPVDADAAAAVDIAADAGLPLLQSWT